MSVPAPKCVALLDNPTNNQGSTRQGGLFSGKQREVTVEEVNLINKAKYIAIDTLEIQFIYMEEVNFKLYVSIIVPDGTGFYYHSPHEIVIRLLCIRWPR